MLKNSKGKESQLFNRWIHIKNVDIRWANLVYIAFYFCAEVPPINIGGWYH